MTKLLIKIEDNRLFIDLGINYGKMLFSESETKFIYKKLKRYFGEDKK